MVTLLDINHVTVLQMICNTDLSDHMTYIDRTPFDEGVGVNAVFILLDVKLAQ